MDDCAGWWWNKWMDVWWLSEKYRIDVTTQCQKCSLKSLFSVHSPKEATISAQDKARTFNPVTLIKWIRHLCHLSARFYALLRKSPRLPLMMMIMSGLSVGLFAYLEWEEGGGRRGMIRQLVGIIRFWLNLLKWQRNVRIFFRLIKDISIGFGIICRWLLATIYHIALSRSLNGL